MFCGGLLVVAASSAACALATDYAQLLAFRAAGGLGSTMFTVSAASLLVRISPPTMRGRASGAWATGFLLGSIAGPVVGGGLIAGSLRAPFFAYAGMLVLTVLITGVLLRAPARTDPVRPVVATVTFSAVVRQPVFRAALASNFVNGWTVYGVRVALVPLFVVEVLIGRTVGRASLWPRSPQGQARPCSSAGVGRIGAGGACPSSSAPRPSR